MINPKDINVADWGWGNPYAQPTTPKTSTNKHPSGPGDVGASSSGTSIGGETMPMADFQYPSEWDQEGDVWRQLASGNYSNTGMDYLKSLLSGGNAFDVSGWDKMYRPAMMDQYSNAVKEMAEQAGVGGSRYGSGLQNSIANYGGQLQNQYTRDLWDRMFGAYEAGQGRAAGAGNLLSQLGLGAMTTGAEGLGGLGSRRAQLPIQVAAAMMGGANTLTGMQVDPWSRMMMELLGPTGQAVPQTYTPSWLQDALGSLGSTLPGALKGWDAQGWWGK